MSNHVCGPGRGRTQIPGGMGELLALRFHHILSLREHEAHLYNANHLCNPVCNTIAWKTKAGAQKRCTGCVTFVCDTESVRYSTGARARQPQGTTDMSAHREVCLTGTHWIKSSCRRRPERGYNTV